jgi:hypothetical protein
MIDWLKKRLSPIKNNADRWTQLAEAIQEFWEGYFDPEMEEVANLRSVYTASEKGQKRIVSELGGYYENDLPDKNIPVCVAFRKLELLQKDTEVPMVASLKRMGVDAEWKPLYARRGEIYGSAFYMEHELDPSLMSNTVLKLDGSWHLGETPPKKLLDGVFLTSRGKLLINMASMSGSPLTDLTKYRVRKIKPLHIVFDGFHYQLWFSVSIRIQIKTFSFLTKLSDCRPLKCATCLDGTWCLGRDEERLSLDGSWVLGDEFKLGQVHWPAMAERTITDCRLDTRAGGGSRASVHAGYPETPSNVPYFRLSYQTRKLDGMWPLGANNRLDGSWKLVPGIRLSSPCLGEYPEHRLGEGLKLGYIEPESGSWPQVSGGIYGNSNIDRCF